MSAKEKQLKEELLRARQQQINNYQQGLQQKAREEEMKLNESIAGEINVFLTEYGRKHGYEFILGANATGNVVYARPARDISEDVLKGLNERYNAQAR
jgi:outer membrane protein